MKISSVLNHFGSSPLISFRIANRLSSSCSILPRNFTTSTGSDPSESGDYYRELREKSKALLEKVKFSEAELLQNKDVVVYIRNRTCTKCNKTVRNSQPEFIEDACADTWRYFHNFSYVPNCPIYGISRFTKYSRLRTEQKILLPSNSSDVSN